MISSDSLLLALISGTAGALFAQVLAIWHGKALERERQRFQVYQAKLSVLQKIAGNRAAIVEKPALQHHDQFFQGLNEVMVVFSGSTAVVSALNALHEALGTPNASDRLVRLFKAMCHDLRIDLTAFNDSLFLVPFQPSEANLRELRAAQLSEERRRRQLQIYRDLMATRASNLSPIHVSALNSISLEFDNGSNDEKPIIDAWKVLHEQFNRPITTENGDTWRERRIELLTDLLYVMGKYLGYDFSKLDIRKGVYFPMDFETLEFQERALREGFAEIVSGKRALPVIVKFFPGKNEPGDPRQTPHE